MIVIRLQAKFYCRRSVVRCLVLAMAIIFCATASAQAQLAAQNQAKYIVTLKVIADHKVNDADLLRDVADLRKNKRFNQDLIEMRGKLDNSRPNSAKNQKIMRILERAGKEIYNELK